VAQDLAEFTFKLRPPGSPEYEGVDTSLDVTLRWGEALLLVLLEIAGLRVDAVLRRQRSIVCL
jgi:hypothetical protein